MFNHSTQILIDFLDTLNSAEPQIISLILFNRKSNCLELQIYKIDVDGGGVKTPLYGNTNSGAHCAWGRLLVGY